MDAVGSGPPLDTQWRIGNNPTTNWIIYYNPLLEMVVEPWNKTVNSLNSKQMELSACVESQQ